MARILVIDDEAPIRLLCRVNLEAAGMEVREASDGVVGLAAAQEEPPDAILLDVMMPGMDGWQVLEGLLEDERTQEIPIVFLTARAELRDQARGLELGGVDYVTKPFNPLELAPLVEDLLERASRGESQDLRRERLAELRSMLDGSWRQRPAKSAVTSFVVTSRYADADQPETAVEEDLAVPRARHPHLDDRSRCQRLRPGGEVLADVRRSHAEAPEPPNECAVVEVAPPGHVGGVRARRPCQRGADPQRLTPVAHANDVHRPHDRALAGGRGGGRGSRAW